MPDMQTTPSPAAPRATSYSDLATVRNRTFDEITVGETASIERTLSYKDIELFAVLSGDVNPQHLDAEFAASTPFHGVIAHGKNIARKNLTVFSKRGRRNMVSDMIQVSGGHHF